MLLTESMKSNQGCSTALAPGIRSPPAVSERPKASVPTSPASINTWPASLLRNMTSNADRTTTLHPGWNRRDPDRPSPHSYPCHPSGFVQAVGVHGSEEVELRMIPSTRCAKSWRDMTPLAAWDGSLRADVMAVNGPAKTKPSFGTLDPVPPHHNVILSLPNYLSILTPRPAWHILV